jgi:hypothetical protein
MLKQIEFHHSRDRLEVEFDSVPSTGIRGAMNDVGFVFDGRARVWHLREKNITYGKGNPAPLFVNGWQNALAVLTRLFGLTRDESLVLSRQRDCAHTQAAERGMEEACGII